MIELELDELLKELDELNKSIIHSATLMLETYGMFPFDLYCLSALNRSVNLIRGYNLMVRDNNFIAAGPLIRLHLDSLLRLYAPSITNLNIDDFAIKIMKGTSLRSLKDVNNQKLTDKHLVEEISKISEFNWVSGLYEDGNRYIHLSEKHIFTSTKLGSKPRSIVGGVKLNDEFVRPEEKNAGTHWMIKITEGILNLINSWTSQKARYIH
jgi:hypothetical protein